MADHRYSTTYIGFPLLGSRCCLRKKKVSYSCCCCRWVCYEQKIFQHHPWQSIYNIGTKIVHLPKALLSEDHANIHMFRHKPFAEGKNKQMTNILGCLSKPILFYFCRLREMRFTVLNLAGRSTCISTTATYFGPIFCNCVMWNEQVNCIKHD